MPQQLTVVAEHLLFVLDRGLGHTPLGAVAAELQLLHPGIHLAALAAGGIEGTAGLGVLHQLGARQFLELVSGGGAIEQGGFGVEPELQQHLGFLCRCGAVELRQGAIELQGSLRQQQGFAGRNAGALADSHPGKHCGGEASS